MRNDWVWYTSEEINIFLGETFQTPVEVEFFFKVMGNPSRPFQLYADDINTLESNKDNVRCRQDTLSAHVNLAKGEALLVGQWREAVPNLPGGLKWAGVDWEGIMEKWNLHIINMQIPLCNIVANMQLPLCCVFFLWGNKGISFLIISYLSF